jgi:hypothetical protein
VGAFTDGVYHGRGVLYVQGGRFDGEFDRGKFVRGKFIFEDGLEYQEQDWDYCHEQGDVRFYGEIMEGVAPGDPLRYPSAEAKPPKLPPGCYDVIDGYYDPRGGCIREWFSNDEVRRPAPEEIQWITRHCRVGKKE